MAARVGVYGIGSIGIMIAQALRAKGHRVVFAVDVDPNKIGRKLASLGGPKDAGVRVSGKLDVEAAKSCDLVVHSTGSRLAQIYPQLTEAVSAGCNVISTCEELSYPYLRHPTIADRIDELARKEGVTIVGTGVNPGFVLDALPAFACGVCQSVRSIEAVRVVEASQRREPLQRKIGLGMDPSDFLKRAREGSMGHVGLLESCALIAYALGWELTEIRQDIFPIVAEREQRTDFVLVRPGQTRGLRQEAVGYAEDARIRLFLEMSIGVENPRDSVKIEGEPSVNLVMEGGVHGDKATVGRVVNSVEQVISAPAGLATVLDLPVRHDARGVGPGRPVISGNAARL